MKIAVIPARSGSKRIPRKNIRSFCGKPMIQYSIMAAQASNLFDEIIVSTDCEEIAVIARQCGATVPFLRPAELSDDRTTTIPVIAHAVRWHETHCGEVDQACCIYATAPFIAPSDLVDAHLLMSTDAAADFVIPVTTFPFPIFRAVEIKQERIAMIWPEHQQTRSQDLAEAYHDVGQFYWGTADAWKNASGLYSAHSLALRIPRYRVQDIDSDEDWRRAELLYQTLVKETATPAFESAFAIERH